MNATALALLEEPPVVQTVGVSELKSTGLPDDPPVAETV